MLAHSLRGRLGIAPLKAWDDALEAHIPAPRGAALVLNILSPFKTDPLFAKAVEDLLSDRRRELAKRLLKIDPKLLCDGLDRTIRPALSTFGRILPRRDRAISN